MLLRSGKAKDGKEKNEKDIKSPRARKPPTPRGKTPKGGKRPRQEYIKVPKNTDVDTVLDRLTKANCICMNDSRKNIEDFIRRFCENNGDSVYCLGGKSPYKKNLQMSPGIVQDKAGNGVGIIQPTGQINYLPKIIPAPFIKTAEEQGEITTVKSAKKHDVEKLGKYIVEKASGIHEMDIDDNYHYYDAMSDSEDFGDSPRKSGKKARKGPSPKRSPKRSMQRSSQKMVPPPPPILPAPKKQVEQLEKKIMKAVDIKREISLAEQISGVRLRPAGERLVGRPLPPPPQIVVGKRDIKNKPHQDYSQLIKGKQLLKPPELKKCDQGYIWSHAERKCIAIKKNMQELLAEQMEKRRKAMREDTGDSDIESEGEWE
jgi:hypothetical protein